MDNGRCTVCPGKCSYDMHYHDRRSIKRVPRTLRFAISSLSDKYTKAERDKIACEVKCRTVQDTKRTIEELLEAQFEKVKDACVRVQSNCKGFNTAEELYTFISLLKSDMNTLRSSQVIDRTKKLIEKLEELANNSSLTLSRRSRPVGTKRRIRTSKRRNQLQTTLTTTNDNSMMIDQRPRSTLTRQADNLPTEVVLFEDDLFTLIQNSQLHKSNFPHNRKYTKYTTEQLIDLTRQLMERHTLIAKELTRRSEGASIGCLSSTQLLALCEYYASSRLLKLDELTHLHSQLQLEIQQSVDFDSSENLSVPVDKLLYLTAIRLCLKSADRYQ